MGALVFNIFIGLVFVYQIFFPTEKRVNFFGNNSKNVMKFNLHTIGGSETTIRSQEKTSLTEHITSEGRNDNFVANKQPI